jgi:NAD-dependent deacetylase
MSIDHPDEAALERVAGWVTEAGAITVLTGAGISTDSGIPDFRGPTGIWTRDPAAQRLATYQTYIADPDVRRRAWRERRVHPAWNARPNAGHEALVAFERAGKLRAVLTQNIDGLHQIAGSSPELVVEVHGTIREVGCLTCGRRTPMADELARVDAGEDDPSCRVCGGLLKSATISFGQALEPEVIDRAVAAAESCELFLAVGSSLTVQPAAGLCAVAVDAGARLVIVNAQPTPYDDLARASGGTVLTDPIGSVLPALAGAVVG